MAHHPLHQEERATEIDRHMPVEQFRRRVGQAAARGVGRRIDQRVDVAVMRNGGCHGGLAIRRVGHIAGNEQAVRPGVAKLAAAASPRSALRPVMVSLLQPCLIRHSATAMPSPWVPPEIRALVPLLSTIVSRFPHRPTGRSVMICRPRPSPAR